MNFQILLPLTHLFNFTTNQNNQPFQYLTDNIFSNVIDPDIISGNLTATISDHLPRFSIIPNMLGNIPGNKSNIYEISNSPVNYAFLAVLCLYYVICHSWPTIRDLSVKKVSGSLGLAQVGNEAIQYFSHQQSQLIVRLFKIY